MSEYSEKELEIDTTSKGFKDIINLIRNDPYPILISTILGLIISVVFAFLSKDIYKSTASLKISKPKGECLSRFNHLKYRNFQMTDLSLQKLK